MKPNKESELSKKKKTYVQNFINWITQQPDNIIYNITNKLGEFKMKQKKAGAVTLEMIHGELIEFKTTQLAWNKKQEEFNTEVKDFMVKQVEFNAKQEKFNAAIKKDIEAIKSCPTIKKELSNI